MNFSMMNIISGMSLVALYVFLFVLCIPAIFIQMKLGGYSQKGIVGLLSQHLPIAKGMKLGGYSQKGIVGLLSQHLPIAN